MNGPAELTVNCVNGPDGWPLTLADLPTPNTKRWVIRRKAEVVAAVRGGLLSLEEVCSRYALDSDEFYRGRIALIVSGLLGCARREFNRT
jgi:hypothetical protein